MQSSVHYRRNRGAAADSSRRNQGAAAEADAIGEQQLKLSGRNPGAAAEADAIKEHVASS